MSTAYFQNLYEKRREIETERQRKGRGRENVCVCVSVCLSAHIYRHIQRKNNSFGKYR